MTAHEYEVSMLEKARLKQLREKTALEQVIDQEMKIREEKQVLDESKARSQLRRVTRDLLESFESSRKKIRLGRDSVFTSVGGIRAIEGERKVSDV
jgi:hypothetical protein